VGGVTAPASDAPAPAAAADGPVRPPISLRTSDAEETRRVAAAIAGCCVPGDVLLLAGDLGAGKTTFAQGFGRELGIAEAITSPTFTLMRQYPVASGPGRRVECLIHADVYRLDHLQEITDLGIGELVEEGGVALVEWGDAAAPVLGAGALTVRLEADPDPDDPGVRTLVLSAAGDAWATRWAALSAAVAPWAAQ
jgi:tRNA threonylcarbamoyladenosine biosynthesis protein TsaE